MEVQNKVVVVTGGGSGMGEACARYLAAAGAKVAIIDRDKTKADAVAKDINGKAFIADVTSSDEIESVFNEIVDSFKAVHVTISCAGIATGARIVSKEGPMPLEEFQKVIQVNLIGTFNVMRIAASKMIAQDPVNEDQERGVIINTASVAAFEGQIGQAAYSASKGGVAALALPAAREFAKFGVRVMTIAPGVIETPMMAAMPEKVYDSLVAKMPFPKRLGLPEEFAHLSLHIINNAYLNADVIRLDAGLRMEPK